MKAPIRPILFFAVVASFLLAPLSAQIDYHSSPRARLIATISSNNFIVSGEVVRRTETDFTVLDRWSQLITIQVSPDTELKKAGALIRLSEMVIGEKITATVMRGGDGRLQAVTVTVRMGTERT